jgi:hypothetical protein
VWRVIRLARRSVTPVLDLIETSFSAMDLFQPKTALEELANEISAAARLMSAYSWVSEKPQAAFGPEAPTIVIAPDAPPKVLKAQQSLIQAAAKIQQLAAEPSEYIPNLQVHVSTFRSSSPLIHD